MPRPRNRCKEHHLRNVGFVLYFALRQVFIVVEVVGLAVLAQIEPLLIEMDEVVEAFKFERPSGHGSDPTQRPIQLPLLSDTSQ